MSASFANRFTNSLELSELTQRLGSGATPGRRFTWRTERACLYLVPQALLPCFLPEQIALYREALPDVTFTVNVRVRVQAEQDLESLHSDFALVFDPIRMVEFEVMDSLPQPIPAVFHRAHPLAQKTTIRHRDCLEHLLVLPSRLYGVGNLLDVAAKRKAHTLTVAAETEPFDLICHYVMHENAVRFQNPIGMKRNGDGPIIHRPLFELEVPAGQLFLG